VALAWSTLEDDLDLRDLRHREVKMEQSLIHYCLVANQSLILVVVLVDLI